MKKLVCLLLVLSVAKNIYSVPDEVVSQHEFHKRGNCQKDHRKGYARGAFYCCPQEESLKDAKLKWHQIMDGLRDSTGVCLILREYALQEVKTRSSRWKEGKTKWHQGPKTSRDYRIEYMLKKKWWKNNKKAEAKLREQLINRLIDAGFCVEKSEMHLNNMGIGVQQNFQEKQSVQTERKKKEREKARRAGMISSSDCSTGWQPKEKKGKAKGTW